MRSSSALLIVPLILLAAALAAPGATRTEAAVPGAAQNEFVSSQLCLPTGAVQARFNWSPSGLGIQYVDVSVFNNGFVAAWSNAGPLVPNQNLIDWPNLQPNTVYYTRVNTFTNFGWLPSDTISFQTVNCASPFTPPANPRTQILSSTSTRFSWDRGNDNQWYCVDTALSLNDLNNLSGSWHNWGCGVTTNSIDATGMLCGTLHYWRVYARGTYSSGYSPTVSFTTGNCGFTPPSNIRANLVSNTTLRFAWDPGVDNQWYCVDAAISQSDLTNLTGSWRNFGCGTQTAVSVSNLDCGTLFYWRVYSHGTQQAGYSPIANISTGDCAFSVPTNLRAHSLSNTSEHFDWDRGRDNQWFCVDTATTQNDLDFFTGSYVNHGCGTTQSQMDVTGLVCNTTYYWRVYARGTTLDGHSQPAQFKTDAC